MRSSAVAICLLLSAPLVSHADVFTTFQLKGTTVFREPFEGTMLFDDTTSSFVSGDVTLITPPGEYPYTQATFTLIDPGPGFVFDLRNPFVGFDFAGDQPYTHFFMGLPVDPFGNRDLPLAGFRGASLCVVTSCASVDDDSYFATELDSRDTVAQGTLVPLSPAAATPEPASLLLVGMGLLGVVSRRNCRPR